MPSENNPLFWMLMLALSAVTSLGIGGIFILLITLSRIQRAYTNALNDVAKAANYCIQRAASERRGSPLTTEDLATMTIGDLVKARESARGTREAPPRSPEAEAEDTPGAEFSSGA